MAAETVQDLLKKKDGEAKPSSKKVASPKKSAKVADKKPAKAVSKEPKATSESLFKPVLQKGGLTIEAFVAKAIQNELKGRVSRPAPLLAQKVLSHAKSKWGVKVDDKGNILGKK